ncbi:2OG-Fe(II) oxygenase [Hyphobacterium sp. HN65]|uniref:2OG-Fe(II) oxygenase n=1 Tax=Hyphobacterium lacteum TaxID=3116575 RepID=A0ABU7LU63_9PROT|nr:2OG-Fe(II) oxygenase [Hyphobacterium sp. HN65]MEE2526874.1 2OG-Fe(II) oxygenase [Hyphobacterium sp. HN65]
MTLDFPAGPAPAPFFGENRTATLIEDLATKGWAHATGALPGDLVTSLRDRLEVLFEEGELARARIGRGETETRANSIRQTEIAWLTGEHPAERQFLGGTEALRLEINRALFAGLFEFEAHFARYPAGGHYARHLDAFADRPRDRIVSLVAWLNADWQDGDGGELDVWTGPDDHGHPVATLAPRGGDLLLMMSETIPHAVRATAVPRLGLAGWFRVNPGVGGVLDPAA